MRSHRFAMLLLLGLTLGVGVSGCRHVISERYRVAADPAVTFPMVLEQPSQHVGETVIWGGVILQVENKPEHTDLTVLETPLDRWGDPRSARHSRGRFIARSARFLDPEVYSRGREVTVAGEVTGSATKQLAEAEYTYPVLVAKETYLWAGRSRYNGYYGRHYYRRGYYGPYYPYSHYDRFGFYGHYGLHRRRFRHF